MQAQSLDLPRGAPLQEFLVLSGAEVAPATT